MDSEKLLKHPLTLIASVFIFLLVSSSLGLKLPISVISQDRGAPLLVEGQGKVAVVPDIAKVSLGIEETGTNLLNVQKSVNQKSNDLVEALKKLGIDEKDIKTTSYNIYPEYNYGGGIVPLSSTGAEIAPAPGRIPTISGYRVSISYDVKIKDFEKVNDVLTVSTQKGANQVGNVSFEVNEDTRNKKLDEARSEAVAQAKQKAQGLASAAGVRLGRILNISESQEFEAIALRDAGVGGAPVPAPEIAPGETELSVTVSVSFEIR